MSGFRRSIACWVVIGVSSFIVVSLKPADACLFCIPLGPVTLTPVGPAPTVVVKQADKVVNKTVAPVAEATGKATGAVAQATVAPQVHLVKVIAGQETLGDAGKRVVQSQGAQIAAVGEAVSAANAAENNVKIVAAESIAGDVGKTVMTIATGPNRMQVEFASTAAIQSGSILAGKLRPEELIAAPLAAAIRAAEKQFAPDAKPIPPGVRAKLAPYFAPVVLDKARWAIGSVSISAPDITNQYRKNVEGVDNAVTVGHVTVFVRDPGMNLHWWAHELQHHVQYHDWGIDRFAFKYVTACHEVETNAEDKAQQAVPIIGKVSVGC
jgi:hypothetical protein